MQSLSAQSHVQRTLANLARSPRAEAHRCSAEALKAKKKLLALPERRKKKEKKRELNARARYSSIKSQNGLVYLDDVRRAQ
jgi:hypothetical protein